MNHDDVMKDIKDRLDRAEPPITEECCIYKVPFDIRMLNEDAYTPKVVSIGPFHRTSPRVQNMQRQKHIYCKNFLERAKKVSLLDLDTLVRHIEADEPKVRHCYSDTLDLTPEELVKVVLVDSCFIFELFWRSYYGDWSGDDTRFMKPWLTTDIRLDLLLLENQLPFFVLDTLFNLAFHCASTVPSFLELTFDYFKHYKSCKLVPSDDVKISHFTDLLRFFHLKPFLTLPLEKGRTNKPIIHLQSATELSEAGVAFEENKKSKCLCALGGACPSPTQCLCASGCACPSPTQCLLDVRFSGKVLEIPQLRVDNWTEILFRNLIALEQCHYPDKSYFTDYVAFLDFLINTGKDVDVLVGEGILVNWLGDADSVAKLFNSLWKNVTYVSFGNHYFGLCCGLDAFCRNTMHHLKATLRRDYGRTPWQAAATFAAIVLLILSLIQTACSVIQVVQQAKQKN